MCQARNEALRDRLADRREHDRYRAGRLLRRPHGPNRIGKYHVWRLSQQFHCSSPCPLIVAHVPTIVDQNLSTDRPPQLLDALLERRNAISGFRITPEEVHQRADPPHSVGLLGARHEWPYCRPAEYAKKFAPLHSLMPPCFRC